MKKKLICHWLLSEGRRNIQASCGIQERCYHIISYILSNHNNVVLWMTDFLFCCQVEFRVWKQVQWLFPLLSTLNAEVWWIINHLKKKSLVMLLFLLMRGANLWLMNTIFLEYFTWCNFPLLKLRLRQDKSAFCLSELLKRLQESH